MVTLSTRYYLLKHHTVNNLRVFSKTTQIDSERERDRDRERDRERESKSEREREQEREREKRDQKIVKIYILRRENLWKEGEQELHGQKEKKLREKK